MIDARQLMIGNYFYDDLENIHKVDALYKDRLIGLINGFSHGFRYENSYPIPITEEWLDKFGIVWKDDNPKQKPHYEGDKLFTINNDYEFSNSQRDCWYSYEINNGNTEFKYVHQLQNWYYATFQEELTIKTDL